MKFLGISVFVLLFSYTYARVITTSIGDNQDVDLYQVQEDSEKHTITMISPKSLKPTLREIIYYHVIEKPYDNQETSGTSSSTNEVTAGEIELTPPYYNYPALPEVETTTKFSSLDVTPVEDTTILNSNIIVDVTDDNISNHSAEEVTDESIVLDISNDSEDISNTDVVPENKDIPVIEDEIKSNVDTNDIKTEYGVFNQETEVTGSTKISILDDFVPVTTENETSDDENINYNINLPLDMDSGDSTMYAGSDGIQPEIELLSRYKRNVEPHTYGMDLVGDHGTVWNDVSARNLRYEVGSDNEIIKDDEVSIKEDDPVSEDIPININDEKPESDPEILENVEEQREIVNGEAPELSEQPEVPTEDNGEEGFNNDTEITGENEEAPEKTKDESGNPLQINDAVNLNEEVQEVTDGDTKQWGMSLNHEGGTVWNNFNAKPIEYQVGNTDGSIPSGFPGEEMPNLEEGQILTSNIELPEPTEPLPAVIPGFEEVPKEEDSDDIFVTPPTRDDAETTLMPTSTIDDDFIEDNTELLPTNTDEDLGNNTEEIEESSPDKDNENINDEDTDNTELLPTNTDEDNNAEEIKEPSPDIDNENINDEDTIYPVAPTLPPLNVDDLPTINGMSIPIDGDMFTDMTEETTEFPEDVTVEVPVELPVENEIIDEIDGLLKNEKFMSWIQTWATAYAELIKNKISDIVKEEVTKQIIELNLLECCSKNNQFSEQIGRKSKNNENSDAKVIYGNSVGNDNVTNVFLFIDKVSDKIVDVLKPLMRKGDGVHYISTPTDDSTVNEDESATTPMNIEFDGTTELPEFVETTDLPKIVETTELPKIVETSELPKIVETSKLPKIIETTELPKIIETTELPKIVETTELPDITETTELPEIVESTELPVVSEKELNRRKYIKGLI